METSLLDRPRPTTAEVTITAAAPPPPPTTITTTTTAAVARRTRIKHYTIDDRLQIKNRGTRRQNNVGIRLDKRESNAITHSGERSCTFLCRFQDRKTFPDELKKRQTRGRVGSFSAHAAGAITGLRGSPGLSEFSSYEPRVRKA